MEKMDTKLKWILPIVPLEKFTRNLFWDETGEDNTGADRKNFDEYMREEKSRLDKVYYENSQNPFQNKYVDFLKNVYSAPFNLLDRDKDGSIHVKTDIEAIIEGAPVIDGKDQNVRSKKWFVQSYNTGYSHLYEEIPKTFIRKSATPNDEIVVQSVFVLPEPVVRFSRIDLPTTDIMTRSSLNTNYFALWRALRANTSVKQKSVSLVETKDDAVETEEKKNMEKEEEDDIEFLSNIKKYVFEEGAGAQAPTEETIIKPTIGAYLQKIVPRTKFLFQKIQKYINEKYSFVDVLKYMEPFMIYPSDITFRQYNFIRRFLQQKIKEKKQERADNIKKYGAMAVAFKSSNSQYINTIYDLFLDATKQDILEVLIKIYFPHFIDIKQSEILKNGASGRTTPAEIISRMIEEDGATLFTNTLANMTLGLTSHEDIIKSVEEFHLKDVAELEKMRPEDREKCITRKIAKKYSNLKDLEKDNGKKDVYYDKEYDKTAYNILDTPDVRTKRKELSPEKFKEFLSVVLIEKYGFDKENINRDTEEMILGKKTVEDGVYAVLSYFIGNDENRVINIEYYRREGDNWVKDTTIDNDNVFIDNNTDMCNISPDCAATKPAGDCHTPKVTSAEIRKNARKMMMSEFSEKYKKTIEESRKTFAELIKKSSDNLERVKILRELNDRRANEFAVFLGKNLALGGDGENDPAATLQSPYYILLEWIFSQTDYVKKQYDILKFYDKYCREPFGDEEHGWLYCKKTNTKLLPLSLYRLADAFVKCGNAIERVMTENGVKQVINNSFMVELGKICAEFGTLSEDSDAIVDKYSGRVLRKIDFSTDEGYDENGFKISTHEVLEVNATMEQKFLAKVAAVGTIPTTAAAAATQTPKKPRFTIKENEVTQMVYNVARTLCSNIFVPFDTIEEFVLQNVVSILEKNVLYLYEKDEYNEKLKTTLKKPFEVYRNQYIIWTTAAIIILGVQCSIPSIKVKKTFPQCIMSFDGYPFHGEGDMSALEYMSCVINKTKSSINPWNSMMKNTDHDMKMKQLLERIILTDENIQISIKKKQEYSITEEALRDTEFMPEMHRIQRWVHFYPPLVPISLPQIRGVGAEFLKEIERTMSTGHKDQRKQFGVLHGKIKEFSFGIIHAINNIVEKSDPLLKTASQVPFMENACCSTNGGAGISTHNVLAYFVEKDDDIMTYEKNLLKVSKVLHDIREMSHAPLLFDSRDTRINYTAVTTNFNTPELIYDTIVHYCRYGLDAPIPHEFLSICPTKYEGFKRSFNTSEKIAFFADHGKKFDYDDMKKLLNLVDAKNIVKVKTQIHKDKRIENFSLLIEQDEFAFLQGDGAMLQKKLSDYIDAAAERENTDVPLKNLHRYLEEIVSFDKKSMADYIMNFLLHRIDAKNKTKIRNFMSDLEKWKTDELMKNNASFYKNAIVFMAKVAPKFLLLGKFNENSAIVHDHWDLESGHNSIVRDIIIASNLKNGYSIEKRIVDGVLTEILRVFEKVDVFIKNIEFFDIKTRIKIYKYLWFRVIYEYINTTLSRKYINKTVHYDDAVEAAMEEDDLQLGDDISSKEIDESGAAAAADTTIVKMEENIYNILMRFFSHFSGDKQNLNKSYSDIFGGAMRAKYKEKEEMKAMFEKMNHDERKVEKTLMEIGMGKWKKGKSKSVFKYDKEAYKEDSEYFNQQMQNEKISGIFDAVTRERVGLGADIEELFAPSAAAGDTEIPAAAEDDMEWNFDEPSEKSKPAEDFEGRGDIDFADIPADGDEIENSIDDDYNVYMGDNY